MGVALLVLSLHLVSVASHISSEGSSLDLLVHCLLYFNDAIIDHLEIRGFSTNNIRADFSGNNDIPIFFRLIFLI